MTVNRRQFLALSALGTAAAGGAFAAGTQLGRYRSAAVPAQPAGGEPQPTLSRGSFVSAARGGVETPWIVARPPQQTGPLRPVIALHMRDGDAAMVMALGVARALAAIVADGAPPIAVAALDGGNGYWHRRRSGADTGAMVLDEFIPMLDEMGCDTSRVGFIGWSMGGYGALLLGARLGAPRTAGICAVSPGLWPQDGFPDYAFDDAEDWAANSVWGRPELDHIPIRIDCGTGDPFYATSQRYAAQLATPPAGGFRPGGHDGEYWSRQVAEELAWLAPLVTAQPPA